MPKQLTFRISSELKSIIGKELITDDFIAVLELVKNSYDAKAKKVELIFNHLKDESKGRIFVEDDGDGMSYDDLVSKWLLVAHSEKVEAEKDLKATDHRAGPTGKRIFAGAKGIGRFSCDRLGRMLKLYTKKRGESQFHILEMDWNKFEQDPSREFQTVDVTYRSAQRLDIEIDTRGFTKGTILEISSLRSTWDGKKLLDLKRHLQRLINPAQVSPEQEFKIYLRAPEFRKSDARKQDYARVNGLVRNILFEKLGIRTTRLSCHLEENEITTRLVDKGTFVYGIVEKNEFAPLHDVKIELFFLNETAKRLFTRTMGIQPVRYGSVFFYKNGIKINPCGNHGDDWLGLDRRKTQGTRRFLGNRDIMGRVEVSGDQPYFREVSSRDGGVVRTPELEKLMTLFKEKALKRLEKFVVEGIDWDSERTSKDPEEIRADSFRIVNQLVGKTEDQAVKIEFNKDLLEIYAKKQLEKTPELIKNIEAVKKFVRTREAKAYMDLQVKAVRSAFRDLRTTQRELEKELEQRERQALFLKSVSESDKSEIIALDHQIGLGAQVIRNHLLDLKTILDKGEPVPNSYLLEIIEIIDLQAQMMSSVTKFVTRANFDLMSQEIDADLVSFVRQYLERVYVPQSGSTPGQQRVKVTVQTDPDTQFKRTFNPFKFVVILDNLIDNSRKAGAKNVRVTIDVLNGKTMELHFVDDGVGIPDKDIDRIFDFGFSTTGGSGIGLYHIKKILSGLGSIVVNNHLEKGVEFIIRVEK